MLTGYAKAMRARIAAEREHNEAIARQAEQQKCALREEFRNSRFLKQIDPANRLGGDARDKLFGEYQKLNQQDLAGRGLEGRFLKQISPETEAQLNKIGREQGPEAFKRAYDKAILAFRDGLIQQAEAATKRNNAFDEAVSAFQGDLGKLIKNATAPDLTPFEQRDQQIVQLYNAAQKRRDLLANNDFSQERRAALKNEIAQIEAARGNLIGKQDETLRGRPRERERSARCRTQGRVANESRPDQR